MGKRDGKYVHQASRAAKRPSDSEKRNILNHYAMLRGEDVIGEPEVPFELRGSNDGDVDLGGLIAALRTNSADLLIDILKKLGRSADRRDIDMSKTLPSVRRLLRTSPDCKVRYEATKVMAKIKDLCVVDDLIHSINCDPSEKVKVGAIKALGLIKAESCFVQLTEIMNDTWDQSKSVRKAAAFALGRLDPNPAVNHLCDSLINDPDSDVRCEAAESIAICLLKLEKNEAGLIVETISSQLDFEAEPEHEVRIAVINAITVAENVNCIDQLISALKEDPNPRVRGQAANALAHFFDPKIERALIEGLDKEKDGIKKRLALALAQYAMKNPICLHDDVCDALIHIQKIFPKGSYIWKEAVKALPAC